MELLQAAFLERVGGGQVGVQDQEHSVDRYSGTSLLSMSMLVVMFDLKF